MGKFHILGAVLAIGATIGATIGAAQSGEPIG
jgi:hypothetical protein